MQNQLGRFGRISDFWQPKFHFAFRISDFALSFCIGDLAFDPTFVRVSGWIAPDESFQMISDFTFEGIACISHFGFLISHSKV